MSLHYLFVSCVVVIGVYVIFAVVAHTERGRVEFCISGMRWIACVGIVISKGNYKL